jgi:WD40 repeat protein/serine/threonine protein kinase
VTPEQYNRVEEVLDKLSQLPATRRQEEMERQCGNDVDVREAVARLLALGKVPTTPAKQDLLDGFRGQLPLADNLDLQVGSSVGPYHILGRIGEGGFGSVYKVEQRHPIRRVVALKLIKAGSDTREVVARFNSERQALARMDHPNIAKVFEAGTTDTGRPYFVMECVAGRAITQFCDENRLTIKERLQLFLQVCAAMTHAHQKAIIHRDIKSTNVLAYMHDGKPQAKVIDFGIAKALCERLTDMTFDTGVGNAIGTYECMSPEQVDGDPDIDTRTDVYSLGVLLYELLVGVPPFDREQMRSAGNAERRRMICEVDPPPPSQRLSALGDEGSRLASSRGSDVDVLTKQLQRELEWIPLKAMRKERSRRYPSVHSLTEDIQNYLEDRPLTAGPESRTYRFKKALRRHAGLFAAVSTIMVVLTLGVLGTTIQSIRAKAAERAARESESRALALAEENGELANRAEYQLGLASLEKSRGLMSEQDSFSAAMLAARAVGFDEDPTGPINPRMGALLHRDTPEWRRAVDLSTGGARLLWRTPCGIHHGGPVRCIAFSPDGKTLVSASDDQTLRLWDLHTGNVLHTFDEHAGTIASVCFSPNGQMLLCDGGAASRSARAWEIATGASPTSFGGFSGPVRSVCYSPDGQWVAAGSNDHTVRVWNATTTERKCSFEDHKAEVLCVTFSPDGKTIASSSKDQTIRVWDSATGKAIQMMNGVGVGLSLSFSPDGKLLAVGSEDHAAYILDVNSMQSHKLQGHTAGVTTVCFSPDGKTLASGSLDRTIRLWAVETFTPMGTIPGDSEVNSVRFSPDCKTLAWGSCDNCVHIWDLSSGKSAQHLDQPGNIVASVSFSPDGLTIASGSRDGGIALYDAVTGKLRDTLSGNSDPGSQNAQSVVRVAYSPDGRTIASCTSRGPVVRLWSVADGKPSELFRGTNEFSNEASVSFSPDGKYLATGAQDNSVAIFDVISGKQTQVFKNGHTKEVTTVCYSPDGKRLASGSNDNSIRIWDIPSGQSQVLNGHSRNVTCMSFSPDGRSLASGSTDNTIDVWDLASGSWRPLQGHTLAVNSVGFSPDGKSLASASADGTIRVWDVATGGPLQIFRGAGTQFTSVSFSPDGRTLASAGSDGTLSSWSLGSDNAKHPPLLGHTQPVCAVRFSPDGRTLASASWDATLHLWDMKTRTSRILKGHTDAVYCLSVSPDGKTVASGSMDRTVRLWDVSTGEELGPPLEGTSRGIVSVAFSHDGKRVAAGSRDQLIYIWDAATRTKLAALAGHTDGIWCLDFSPDDKILASGSRDQSIRLWDMDSLQPHASLPMMNGHTDRVASVCFSPDGTMLASASYDHTVCVRDLKTGKPIWTRAVSSNASANNTNARNWLTSVAFNRDGTVLACGADDGMVRLWDAATGRQLHADRVSEQGIFGVSFSPDGKTLACGSNDHAIYLCEVQPSVPLRQYLQVYRLEGLNLGPQPAANLYRDDGFRAQTLP